MESTWWQGQRKTRGITINNIQGQELIMTEFKHRTWFWESLKSQRWWKQLLESRMGQKLTSNGSWGLWDVTPIAVFSAPYIRPLFMYVFFYLKYWLDDQSDHCLLNVSLTTLSNLVNSKLQIYSRTLALILTLCLSLINVMLNLWTPNSQHWMCQISFISQW